MNRYLALGVAVTAMIMLVGGGIFLASKVEATPSVPTIMMVGNGGVCSLSSHKSFRMQLSGFVPGSTVQIKVSYANGNDYPYALKNHGQVTLNAQGSHIGPPWPCWPNKQYNVADKKTGYVVFAFQLGSKPLTYAASTFQVVK